MEKEVPATYSYFGRVWRKIDTKAGGRQKEESQHSNIQQNQLTGENSDQICWQNETLVIGVLFSMRF